MHLPWTNLSKESAVISLSDLFIVVHTVGGQEKDIKKVFEKEFEQKMMQLSLAKLLGLDVPAGKEEQQKKGKTAEQG